jgi:repressor LexA
MKGLTDRQKLILNIIAENVETYGYPPSYQELADRLNISSKNSIKKHVDALVSKGYLEKGGLARTLKIIDSNYEPKSQFESEVPLIGYVAAGFQILAEQNIERYVPIPRAFIKSEGKYFALRVRGDSMIDAGIFEDDLVIVKATNVAEHMDIVVALINDEVTVKRLITKGDLNYLKAENPAFNNIYPQESWAIHGKVVGLVRENI